MNCAAARGVRRSTTGGIVLYGTPERAVPECSEHLLAVNGTVSCPSFVPDRWSETSTASILERQEYTGDTVNFRSTTRSFKDKTRIDRPKEGAGEGSPRRAGGEVRPHVTHEPSGSAPTSRSNPVPPQFFPSCFASSTIRVICSNDTEFGIEWSDANT